VGGGKPGSATSGSADLVLALLSLYELIRKRNDTDVAFTKEFSWDIESKE
jgi:hypothetical protein